ncbi:MAG: SDR family NAD(P)-dependent oxidoreductase, partial [Mesorhizobium sp.]
GLASGDTESTTYTLTGPQAHTVAEIAALVTDVTGKPIEVVQLSDEALTEGLTAAGVPSDFAPVVVSFDTNTRSGRIAMVTDAIETLSGKKPQSLKQFLESNKAVLAG